MGSDVGFGGFGGPGDGFLSDSLSSGFAIRKLLKAPITFYSYPRSCLEHGKAGMHEHHEEAAEKCPSRIDAHAVGLECLDSSGMSLKP